MNKLLKWGLGGLAIIFSGLVFAGVILVVVLYGTLPEDEAKIEFSGLEKQAEAVFDKHGIPHIRAYSHTDAMKVLGFVHARDRLWQMDFMRRAGEGRLSELFGDATIKTDMFLRSLDMAGAARKSYDKLLPETKAALEAYAKGINAYLNRPTEMFEASLGAEFLVFSHKPEPWEAWNSVLILKLMGLTLSGNMDREIQRMALVAKGFTVEEMDEIIPYNPRDNPTKMPDLKRLYGFSSTGKYHRRAEAAGHPSNGVEAGGEWVPEDGWDVEIPTGRSASNNWVVSGSKTGSGKPMLGNDPHLALTAPSSFYLAHVSWGLGVRKREVIGGMLPGIPFVIAGRNTDVAWGLTTTNADTQDLFIEEIKPDEPEYYRVEDGWEKFATKQIEIEVSGGETVTFTRRVSRNGPVLPENFRNLEQHLPDGTVAALQWVGLAEDDTSLDTLYLNAMARSVDDLLKGMERAVSPMQSVVIADTNGNIALATPGRLPVRKFQNRVIGRAPVPGWLSQYQWEEVLQSSQLESYKNPENGAFATANGHFFPPEYLNHITYDWAEQFRQQRIEKWVYDDSRSFDRAWARKVMADDLSVALRKLVRLSARQSRLGAGKAGRILQALARWDGRMRADRAEPLVALALFRHLHENILKDDLGENYSLFARGRITRIIGILERGTSRKWCDDKGSSFVETCGDMIMKSLDEAIQELEKSYGEDWREWQYGQAHMASSEHRPFGSQKFLANFFNIQVPSAGGPYTLHRGQTDFSKPSPYFNRHGGAYRAIYDLEDLDNSEYIISTGQSGNFLSKHYDDMAPLWAQSQYLKMTTKELEYSKGKTGTWIFTPQ